MYKSPEMVALSAVEFEAESLYIEVNGGCINF